MEFSESESFHVGWSWRGRVCTRSGCISSCSYVTFIYIPTITFPIPEALRASGIAASLAQAFPSPNFCTYRIHSVSHRSGGSSRFHLLLWRSCAIKNWWRPARSRVLHAISPNGLQIGLRHRVEDRCSGAVANCASKCMLAHPQFIPNS